MNNHEVRQSDARDAGRQPRRHEQMVKITIVGLVGAFLIFYIMTSPDQAASIAKGAGHLTSHVAHGVGSFIDNLAK
jgi:hypothetical protein